jgi:hypothetical protein
MGGNVEWRIREMRSVYLRKRADGKPRSKYKYNIKMERKTDMAW